MNIIQSIFEENADEYIEHFGSSMPHSHQKVIRAVRACRTGECGRHLFTCEQCGSTHSAGSSCGNRHCPVCQHSKAVKWVYNQQLKLLPCNYFMVTFTIPQELRSVARSNQRVVYSSMFRSAAESLRTLEADSRFVGCKTAGFSGVLHTWGRQLQYHPHIHFVVPGGGLNAARTQWKSSGGNFLVHVRALSRMYRGKMKQAMKEAGLLDLVDPSVWSSEWVVHCQSAGDGRAVMKYLGAYVMRVAIAPSRIVSYNGRTVRFKYQKVGSSKWRYMTLTAMEFMRRFLQHVLPSGFMKIRHYGFLSPNFSVPLQKIRELICVLYELLRNRPVKIKPPDPPKPLRCLKCSGAMQWSAFIPPRTIRIE